MALLPLLTPSFMHPALDAAGSAGWLGVSEPQAHALSDRAVEELILGPGTFGFPGPDGAPFLDADERRHLGDARTLLLGTLGVGVLAIALLALAFLRAPADARPGLWRAVATGAAITAVATLVLGLAGAFAFDPLFRLFHEVAFPGGNWAFDPGTQRLVRLYPTAFWQLAVAALGILIVAISALTWVGARTLAGRTPS